MDNISGVDAALSGCGGPRDVTPSQGVILSHAGAGTSNYNHYVHCVWSIAMVPGSQTTLTFNSFDLEYDSSCQYDNLKVIQ